MLDEGFLDFVVEDLAEAMAVVDFVVKDLSAFVVIVDFVVEDLSELVVEVDFVVEDLSELVFVVFAVVPVVAPGVDDFVVVSGVVGRDVRGLVNWPLDALVVTDPDFHLSWVLGDVDCSTVLSLNLVVLLQGLPGWLLQ